jgi:hypothetical protein
MMAAVRCQRIKELFDWFYLFHWLNGLFLTEPIEQIKPIKPIKPEKDRKVVLMPLFITEVSRTGPPAFFHPKSRPVSLFP